MWPWMHHRTRPVFLLYLYLSPHRIHLLPRIRTPPLSRPSPADMARIDWTKDSIGAMIAEPREEGGILSTGIQKATNRMHSKLLCSLCNGFFVDPVTAVRCGHGFCLPCYHQWAKSRGLKRSPYLCAICETPFVHLAPNWAVNEIVKYHVETLEANQSPGWFGPSAEIKTAYESRLTAWNARKAGIRETFTHPEELVSLVPFYPVKPAS